MTNESSAEQPFAGLTPDVVIESLERLGIECDGRLFALNSYENRVYQVGVGAQEMRVPGAPLPRHRLPRPARVESHALDHRPAQAGAAMLQREAQETTAQAVVLPRLAR